ncbi:MAG TPA: zinc-dependent alcohol dehydrogenase family protein [Clostridia bacterium]|nr:zinc-dependent alcohol dehydrogenase family protein [Clostridia bacterium]
MKAMLLHKARPIEEHPLRLEDVALPDPADEQVRVRVSVCGLCRTDLHTVEGDLALPKLPVVPGHQVVGVVDAVGKRVRTHKEGDRIGVPWLYWTCGECTFCRSGRENLCERAKFTGLHANGGYADALVVDERFAFRLPDAFTDENVAPLLCAGVIGYRSYKLSGISSGGRLGLFGFGASAHIVLQLARFHKCEVHVFTRTESHRKLARELGAAWVGGADESSSAELDSAIVFAPAGKVVPEALRHVRKGGTVALAGIAMTEIPPMAYSLLYYEKVLRSAANSTRDDVREFLQLATDIPIRTAVQSFALEDANEALSAMKHSRIEGAGVLRVNR